MGHRPRAYTEIPELHPNILVGSLQLLGWLFFHPLAWSAHLRNVDPHLTPNFALVDLSLAQWRNPALKRVLARCFLMWPALLGLFLMFAAWFGLTPITHVFYGVALTIALGVTLSIALSVPAGLIGGLAFGLGQALISPTVRVDMGQAEISAWHTANAITFGVAIGVVGSLLLNLPDLAQRTEVETNPTTYFGTRQARVVVFGTLVAMLILGTVAGTINPLLAILAIGTSVHEIRYAVAPPRRATVIILGALVGVFALGTVLDLIEGQFALALLAVVGEAAIVQIKSGLSAAESEHTRTRLIGLVLLGAIAAGFAVFGFFAAFAGLSTAVHVEWPWPNEPYRAGASIIIVGHYYVTLFNQVTFPIGEGLGPILGSANILMPSTVAMVLAAWLRSRRFDRGLLWGSAYGFVVALVLAAINSDNPIGTYREQSFPGTAQLGLEFGLFVALWFGGGLTLLYLVASWFGGRIAGVVVGVVVGGTSVGYYALAVGRVDISPEVLVSSVSILVGLTLSWWRPLLSYPFELAWNSLLYQVEERRGTGQGTLLHLNAAFWDRVQRYPLHGLDTHLVLAAERDAGEAEAAYSFLQTRHQRWAVLRARVELDARRLERCTQLDDIIQARREIAAGTFEGPASALLRSFANVSRDVEASMSHRSSYNRRLALGAVEDRLNDLIRDLTRSSDPYAQRFLPIIASWHHIVIDQVRLLEEAVELRQELDNPYVIGVPLTAQQEIFVGRTDAIARIEHLLKEQHPPPILLYGQRRMGKTSLLNNLGRLLPSTVVHFFIDLQGPPTQAVDNAGFLYNLAWSMERAAREQHNLSLPSIQYELVRQDPFTFFDHWLHEVENMLGSRTALLELDEFETLDYALKEGRFDQRAVLGMLRHIIQHRPRFKVMLAGSRSLEEVQHWASYLINVQVVKLGYLRPEEACQLIEHPVREFQLQYEPEALQRVLVLTRGHPLLLQLLCAEIVALKNEQEPALRRHARLVDVAAAVESALNTGFFFFSDIEHNQIDAAGRAILAFMGTREEGVPVHKESLLAVCPDRLEDTLALLLRRDLIEQVNGGYRFQVELIRRWFGHRSQFFLS